MVDKRPELQQSQGRGIFQKGGRGLFSENLGKAGVGSAWVSSSKFFGLSGAFLGRKTRGSRRLGHPGETRLGLV